MIRFKIINFLNKVNITNLVERLGDTGCNILWRNGSLVK